MNRFGRRGNRLMTPIAFGTFAVEVTRIGRMKRPGRRPTRPVHPRRNARVGGLQFSVALFQGGRVPAPSRDDLCEMVQHFGAARRLGLPSEAVSETGPLSLAAGSFEFGENFLHIWYASDGLNFAFFTYTCEAGQWRQPNCRRARRLSAALSSTSGDNGRIAKADVPP